MARMTLKQYLEYEQRNKDRSKASSAKPEQVVCNDTVPKAQREEVNASGDAPRITVHILSKRRRLLDPDNLVGGVKFHLDSLRYTNQIPGDNPEQIKLEVEQVKVKTKEEEQTEITITYDC